MYETGAGLLGAAIAALVVITFILFCFMASIWFVLQIKAMTGL